MDWSKHMKFCENVNQYNAKFRRNICFKTIEAFPNTVFNFLFRRNVANEKCFFYVSDSAEEPFCVVLRVFKDLMNLCPNFSTKKYQELSRAIDVTLCDVNGKIHSVGIPILFTNDDKYSIYTVGSSKISQIAQSVEAMPKEIVNNIYLNFAMQDELLAPIIPSLLKEL